MKQGCVYLVGAGCGAADLITVRGLRLLRACDVVVYDDLIAPALLEEVPLDAEKHYMGKRLGAHSASQAEICKLLIAKAQAGKTVVRLKGGDPFVFGRGGEEMLALIQAGVPCEEVPGISSAIAIPAEAGIPVTHRRLSRSVHIVTAHTADTPDGLPEYLDQLAVLPGTLVFLMGLGQLPRIVHRLAGAGMALDTPAAVISGGNAPRPMTVRGTLADIVQRCQSAQIQPPAVIVVGAVAAMELRSPQTQPLEGVSVALTGTAEVTDKLARGLRERGARAFLAERSMLRRLPMEMDLNILCDGRPHWVVFTSGNGAELLFAHLREQKVDLRRLHACRFAVIGAATREKLAAFGIQADLCPAVFTSRGLAQALLATAAPGEDFYLFRSARGSRELYQTLAGRYPVRDVPLYDLEGDPQTAQRARERLEGADYLTFSSASGVELYFETHGHVPGGTTCVCIGEVTAAALRHRYAKPFLTAREISAQGIIEAISAHRAGRSPRPF